MYYSSYNYANIKVGSYDYLSLEKTLVIYINIYIYISFILYSKKSARWIN